MALPDRLTVLVLASLLAVAWASVSIGAQPQNRGFGQVQTPRDTPAQPDGAAVASDASSISGRVLDGRTGQTLKRARVVATSRNGGGNRTTVQTDESGSYILSGLEPGQYTLRVSKPGFISLSYGQRRPRQPSTPLDVLAGQTLRNVDVTLPAGSVITGRIVDEDGSPLPLATVRLFRYVYQQGRQQLVPAGADRSDDRGQYRIFYLEPGDYYVNAAVPRQLLAPRDRTRGPGIRFPPFRELSGRSDEPLGYAPTYYPGVTSISEAARVSVGLSAELAGIDFAVRLVPTASVSGMVLGPDGRAASGVQVMLLPDGGVTFRDATMGARLRPDGRFEIQSVPPGQYILRAMTRGGGRRGGRAGLGGAPMFASQPLAVDGYDVTDATLMLTRGATVTGSVVFETSGRTPPGATGRFRVTANAVHEIPLLGNPNERIADDGTFVMENVPGGARLLRASGAPNGWMLKSVYLDGQDVIDTPLDFNGVTRVDDVRLVFTDKVSQLTGLVRDQQGNLLTDFTVIAFPFDETLWQPESRHTKATRPDQNARYRIDGLPPGNYLLAAADAVQQGEWFDPRFLRRLRDTAMRLSLAEGETRDLDLTLNASVP